MSETADRRASKSAVHFGTWNETHGTARPGPEVLPTVECKLASRDCSRRCWYLSGPQLQTWKHPRMNAGREPSISRPLDEWLRNLQNLRNLRNLRRFLMNQVSYLPKKIPLHIKSTDSYKPAVLAERLCQRDATESNWEGKCHTLQSHPGLLRASHKIRLRSKNTASCVPNLIYGMSGELRSCLVVH